MNPEAPSLTPIRASAGAAPAGPRALAIELGAVFTLGVMLMTFLYAGTGGPSGAERGLPGNDDFYHVKMSMLMPSIGLPEQFPWLSTTLFADRFVNHHWGFQALMAPFVALGERLYGDPLAGARWAITVFFSLAMALFDLLLVTERVRFRWLWLGLFLVMPAQFFGRQVFVRAIAPSLACMFGILVLMFRRRYAWSALVIALYVHVYLGALCYVPLLVGAYFLSGLVGAEEDDRVSWKLPVWAVVGLALGWATHPYRDGVYEFLKVQVFGSGLTPEISVGREWKSYDGQLWSVVFEQFGSTLSLLVVAIVARMRMGDRLNAREAAVLLINFAFLVLAVRQRRFIEYWPPFGLLASAMLVGPLLAKFSSAGYETAKVAMSPPQLPISDGPTGGRDHRNLWPAAALMLALGAWAGTVLLLWRRGPSLGLGPLVAQWHWAAIAVGFVALAPLLSAGSDGTADRRRTGVSLLCAAALAGMTLLPVTIIFKTAAWPGSARWVSIALAGVLLIGGALLLRRAPAPLGGAPVRAWGRIALLAVRIAGGSAMALLLLAAAGPQLVGLQRSSRCSYNLPAIREAMDYLKSASSENAIVFTDDWDVFPVFFYHNHHNRYIVGLDPMFSHSHDPLLYARYVKITQSKKFPATAEANVPDGDGGMKHETAEVKLENIRDHFHAEFVIVDPDHRGIGRHLEAASGFAERVFPAESRDKDHWPPYTIYRIKPAAE